MVIKTENRCPGCRRISCDGCGIYQKKQSSGGESDLRRLNTNKQIREHFPEGFEIEPEAGTESFRENCPDGLSKSQGEAFGRGLWGISFDVGTTTLAGMLWDLRSGILLGARTETNPQAAFGADVISRIQAAADGETLKKMQKVLTEKLDEMAQRLVRQQEETLRQPARRPKEEGGVSKAVFVGNTAMCEILLGIKPEGLSAAPFTPDYAGTVQVKGKELGFCFLKNANVTVLPPIGGYVGSDALAVYTCVNRQEPEMRVLAADIGTNGEILLRCGKRSRSGEENAPVSYACSAAAGPALEGGAVSQGMRAADGAIDAVSVSGSFPMQDITCHVLGEGRPAGICGSGLVDALAVLFKTGVLDDTGYMRNPSEAGRAGVPGRICRRIRTMDGERKFLLTKEECPVYLTAKDVRQLQLAVSALRSGMEVLLKKAGLRVEELDRVYLAGAFGCYIRKESALAAGLLPGVSEEKVIQAGNLAGVGCAMALLSKSALEKMEKEAGELVHVELAEEEEFKERFLENLNFHH
ncbi:MAG: ASKHA domain-containing protein [Lachnospiraceae bacterium]|nr:ASKHA domain-containing protein [Lachnospiraceae bacterium]